MAISIVAAPRAQASYVQQGPKLAGAGEVGVGEFGASVALSASGDTALVGAPGDAGGAGAVWVFTRSGSSWIQQGEKLTAPSEAGAAGFGGSVALSADGDTALIGGAADAQGAGAAWVFTRAGSEWAPQGEKLTAAGESGPAAFGRSVALSADGSTALIGGPRDNPAVGNPIPEAATGAAWVFTRSGATWSQQGDKLTGAGETGPARFGASVALSGDGNTAIVGGPNNEWCVGGAWVLARSGAVWSQQALLRGTVETSACDDGPDDGSLDEIDFGRAVALSADGNLALVSAPFLEPALRQGGTWSYARGGSGWTEKTALRDGKGTQAGASSLAVSGDGHEVLLGKAELGTGAFALPFLRAGSEWAPEGPGLLPGDEISPSVFGHGVALSASAGTALIGGPSDNGGVGAAWAFAEPVLPPPGALTGAASAVTPVSALLNGAVDPDGQEVLNCHFEYGTTVAYGSNVSCSSLPGSGEAPVEVSAPANGLTPNTAYHLRIVAAGGGGVSYGADQTFTTLPGPPAVVTGMASATTQTTATLNATVNPLGEPVGDCHFEYGPSTSYGSRVPCASLPGSGRDPVQVSAAVTGLGDYRPYHFRIVATNTTGTSYGSDGTFDTLSFAPDYGRCTEGAPRSGLYANGVCTKWGSTGRFEWHPGAPGTALHLSAGALAVETVKRSLVTCKAATGSGEYSGRKTLGGIVLILTGCELGGQRCTSSLRAEGEVVTSTLEGVLGVERLGKTSSANKVGVELLPAANAPFMEFTCGVVPVTVRGAAIAPVVTNRMLVTAPLRFSATRGKQHPERFLGGPAAILEASIAGQPFEQAAVRAEATETSSQAVETNSVA